MKIKAAIVRKKSAPFVIEEIELDEPRDNEVIVKVASCGLCHTDLAAKEQHLPTPLPAVLGHEGSGIVDKIGSRVTKVKPGDHVVMSYVTCGNCGPCKSGMPVHCPTFFPLNFFGKRADGSVTMHKGTETIYGSFFGQSAFASYSLATENNVVKVPDNIPLEILGSLGCGIQTGAGGVINTLKATPGSSIALFGAGTVGISAIMAAYICGCTKIIAVDVSDERLKTAKEFGATHTVNSTKVDPIAEIQKITGGGADYSLECTGLNKVLRQAFDSIKIGGACGLIGSAPMGMEVNLDMQNILNGRTLVGIVEGDSVPEIFIPKLIELYTQGRLPFDKMMKFYSLDQINQAVEDMGKGKVLKAVLRP